MKVVIICLMFLLALTAAQVRRLFLKIETNYQKVLIGVSFRMMINAKQESKACVMTLANALLMTTDWDHSSLKEIVRTNSVNVSQMVIFANKNAHKA